MAKNYIRAEYLFMYLFTSERCKKGIMKKLFATGVLAILVKQRNGNSE